MRFGSTVVVLAKLIVQGHNSECRLPQMFSTGNRPVTIQLAVPDLCSIRSDELFISITQEWQQPWLHMTSHVSLLSRLQSVQLCEAAGVTTWCGPGPRYEICNYYLQSTSKAHAQVLQNLVVVGEGRQGGRAWMTKGAVVIKVPGQLWPIVQQGGRPMRVMLSGGDAAGPWDWRVQDSPRASTGLHPTRLKPTEDGLPRPARLGCGVSAGDRGAFSNLSNVL